MARRSKKRKRDLPRRSETSITETLRNLENRKRRKRILVAVAISVVLIAAVSVAVIFSGSQPAGVLPGILVTHIYDATAYVPPCPSPLQPLFANVTVSLSGTKSSSANATVGLIAFQGLPPGNYTVVGKAVGFQQATQSVTVTSGTTTHVCLALTKNP